LNERRCSAWRLGATVSGARRGQCRGEDLLQRLAEVSRQLIDAMSDVVWAINPERDSLRDLLQRMRRFAADTLNTQDIQVIFDWPWVDVAAT
jgi:hypothetical protein